MAINTLLIMTERTNNMFIDIASLVPDTLVKANLMNNGNPTYIDPGIIVRNYENVDLSKPNTYRGIMDLIFVSEFIDSITSTPAEIHEVQYPYQCVIIGEDKTKQIHRANITRFLMSPNVCMAYCRRS